MYTVEHKSNSASAQTIGASSIDWVAIDSVVVSEIVLSSNVSAIYSPFQQNENVVRHARSKKRKPTTNFVIRPPGVNTLLYNNIQTETSSQSTNDSSILLSLFIHKF